MLVSEKVTCISAYSFRGCSRPRFGSYSGIESSFTSLSTRKSLSLVKDKTKFSGSTCRFSVTKKYKYFPGICEAARGKAATPPIPGLSFQRNSMFLYSLLKSAANAVLKLMSAVIAIAHVLFASIKSLSVNIMLLEYSFGKLKYDSTTLPISGFLGSSPISDSRPPVSLAILNFFNNHFSVWISPTATLRTKISIDVPVDRIPEINLRLDAGMINCPTWAAQEGLSLSFLLISCSHGLRPES